MFPSTGPGKGSLGRDETLLTMFVSENCGEGLGWIFLLQTRELEPSFDLTMQSGRN
jgi:hypothetical protein